ncbi:unnamed protein product [Penicillium camemberti]|uniref:Str. FM013 n=1 Tax=Penicillium camemberti (strain FM 013) TaxID=1429867 RepID=A0A0G4PT06_PENC3|nr:unnamed protein product [Penicillium camemberti]
MKAPWARAREGRWLKADLLRLMHEMIGDEVSNVDSAMIQVVGRVQETECRSYLQGHGPIE